jgi:hypothetical protein
MGRVVSNIALRFAGVFLLAFAGLLVAWGVAGIGDIYRRVVLDIAAVASPALTGWWLELHPPPPQEFPFFEKQGQTVVLVLNPAILSLAQVPLFSLILATPGLAWRDAVVRCALGALAVFALHIAVVLVYPLLLADPNLFKDSAGVFLGLLSFVLAPQLLWFVLTYPELSALWRLDGRSAGGERRR